MMTQSYHSVQADRHFYSGDLKAAEACCRRLLSADRNDRAALMRLGDIASARGDLRAAESLYRRAAATDRLSWLAAAGALAWAF
ncbi:MAG: tetratricopeptide repeat protein [Desulfovibrio sp.]|nr:tetratricopeptide repeat protein [Desulfovibrio sp.]